MYGPLKTYVIPNDLENIGQGHHELRTIKPENKGAPLASAHADMSIIFFEGTPRREGGDLTSAMSARKSPPAIPLLRHGLGSRRSASIGATSVLNADIYVMIAKHLSADHLYNTDAVCRKFHEDNLAGA